MPRTARWPAPLLLPRSRLTVVVLHSINKYSREKPAHKGSVFTDSNLPRLCTSFTLVSNSVQKPFVCPHWIKSSAHLSFCTIRGFASTKPGSRGGRQGTAALQRRTRAPSGKAASCRRTPKWQQGVTALHFSMLAFNRSSNSFNSG